MMLNLKKKKKIGKIQIFITMKPSYMDKLTND